MDGGRAGSGSASGSDTGACPFLRRQSVKRTFSTMAEARRSSSPDSLFVSQHDHHYNNAHAAHRHTPLALPPTARRPRYAGDGLDYRRPTTTTSSTTSTRAASAGMGNNSTVIDLTLEEDSSRSARTEPEASLAAVTPEPGPSRAQQRVPNFHSHNIFDIESDAEEREEQEREPSRGGPSAHHTRRQDHNQHHHLPAPHYPLHRDHNTVNAASRNSPMAPPPRTLPAPWEPPAPRNRTAPQQTGAAARDSHTIDLTGDDDDDEVVLTDVRPRFTPQLNTGRPEATAGTGTRAVVDRMFGAAGAAPAALMERIFGFGGAVAGGAVVGGAQPGTAHNVRLAVPHGLNVNLEYTIAAFAVGEALRPPTPKYEEPPDAEPGFTRSPGEDEEVVCPNCGDELCMGDNDVKQQVWVVKACGHAYCGECARDRGIKTPKPKGKGKAKAESSADGMPLPMKKCQVIGCEKAVTAKTSMLRVYVDG
ncbi:uncharacterized protein RCC_09195 [Ramularia collo-cygni]|uniref:RING-type domain-containing protein n=1 Tax=Ramularia collo-cygni TaxID=112498 RepID=A0A2D3VH19_9PEZI|nr:uncharacterized protein RCC_09195 [Ramularia collo-cygni]CZT23481.1 uncharacterized protein RCC_09195 [Ramularia collo-cygni]